MSNGPPNLPSTNPVPLKRELGHASSTAYYVTRTTHRLRTDKTDSRAPAARSQAEKPAYPHKTHGAPLNNKNPLYMNDQDFAFKGAMASIRHRPQTQPIIADNLITPNEAKLSKAGSKAALQTAHNHTGTFETKATMAKKLLANDQGARKAATGAMVVTQKAEPRALQDELPDLSQALPAAFASQRAVKEEQVVTGHGEPQFDPVKIHQVAMIRTQQSLASSLPFRGTQDEATKKGVQKAAALTMAKQLYPTAPPAETPAELEASEHPGFLGQQMLPLESRRREVDLMSEAQKRVSLRLAKMDDEQRLSRMYQNPRPSSRPASIASSRGRRLSSGDAETSSFTRGSISRRGFARHSLRMTNGSHTVNGINDMHDNTYAPEEDAVMKMARKRADNTLDIIDQNLYMRTGRPSPAVLREWERKANERAMAIRAPPTSTFISPAGTKLEDNPNVQALARTTLQPTLDAIDRGVDRKKSETFTKKIDSAREKEHRKTLKQREIETKKVHQKLLRIVRKEASGGWKQPRMTDVDGAKRKRRSEAEEALSLEEKRTQKTAGEQAAMNGSAKAHPTLQSSVVSDTSGEPSRAGDFPETPAQVERDVAQPTGQNATATQHPVVPAASAAAPLAEDSVHQEEPRQAGEGMGGIVRQWSTSNDGESLGRGKQKQPISSKRSSERFSFRGFFGRSAPADTGKQGSFEVQKRTEVLAAAEEAEAGPSSAPVSVDHPVPMEATPQSKTAPRGSRFQEDL
ncbi:Eisosome assembly protein [Ophidiomyces ophidiicola]|nr:Eisosome assembly protein [Ophidiomyces ophidiicola]KAI1984993.1 Eisosome assembly protein [Ophidiomyces ophidiicola]KAI1987490.1 Eisosome assembly protein [Ophidiomyces ophidiicola]